MKIGLLHPGLMGTSLAAALKDNQHEVCWSGDSRSPQTKERAESQQLTDLNNLSTLCAQCEVILSVCPPGEALNVAQEVCNTGFDKTYVDCNAIAPSTSVAIKELLARNQIDFIDAGIIGPPAWQAGSTRLFLSGQHASSIASLFSGSLVEAICLDDKAGTASAMKMAYAAWTKGSDALLLNVFALAEHHNLGNALTDEWAISQQGLKAKLDRAARTTAPKAWRFEGEMEQIAQTLRDAGLADGAFVSAASVYGDLSGFKSTDPQEITTDAVIGRLNNTGKTS